MVTIVNCRMRLQAPQARHVNEADPILKVRGDLAARAKAKGRKTTTKDVLSPKVEETIPISNNVATSLNHQGRAPTNPEIVEAKVKIAEKAEDANADLFSVELYTLHEGSRTRLSQETSTH